MSGIHLETSAFTAAGWEGSFYDCPVLRPAPRTQKVAFALIDQAWMPRASEIFERFDPITADFTYICLLGDHKGIEQQTKDWEKVIVDRSKHLRSWVDVCERTTRRGVSTFVYVNNHYAGHAPATVESDDSSICWKDIFTQAANEPDRAKLNRLVREPEMAIFRRREELGNSAEARKELSTMAVATEALRSIRVQHLGDGKPAASNCTDGMPETA